MRRVTLLGSVAAALAVAAVVLLTFPAGAWDDDNENGSRVTVLGGWEATFDDGRPEEYSIFSVAAVIEDGTADGQFYCEILDPADRTESLVIVSGDVQDGWRNKDGSVTLEGVGHGYFMHEYFEDCPFSVTLWKGGPGKGRFLYSDCAVPPPGDAETVSDGLIVIRGGDDD